MSLLIWMIGTAVADTAAPASFRDQLEMQDWSDPERAAQWVDAAAASFEAQPPDAAMLEVEGMVYADVHRDTDVTSIIARLDALAARDAAAARAARYVQAYALYQGGHYSGADAELGHIDIEPIGELSERYRFSILRGNILRMLGKVEAALPYLERGLDIAHEMQDDVRGLHAMLWLARIYTNTGNYERASAQLDTAQRLATRLGDEAALVEVEGCISYPVLMRRLWAGS